MLKDRRPYCTRSGRNQQFCAVRLKILRRPPRGLHLLATPTQQVMNPYKMQPLIQQSRASTSLRSWSIPSRPTNSLRSTHVPVQRSLPFLPPYESPKLALSNREVIVRMTHETLLSVSLTSRFSRRTQSTTWGLVDDLTAGSGHVKSGDSRLQPYKFPRSQKWRRWNGIIWGHFNEAIKKVLALDDSDETSQHLESPLPRFWAALLDIYAPCQIPQVALSCLDSWLYPNIS
jgi:hypothetical protein